MLLRLVRLSSNFGEPFPEFRAGFFLGFAAAMLLGAVSSRAFDANNIWKAIYCGGTAPITLGYLVETVGGPGSH